MKLQSHVLLVTLLLACALSPLMLAAGKKAGPMPDLTKGGKPDDKSAIPLGPTGMRGWLYHQHLDTSKSRQILVTVVEKGSPSDGKIELKDVILGASGNGKDPVAFSDDSRMSFALALAEAEARDPAELRLLVWRNGNQKVVSLSLRTMGAYSNTAPYDCPKSARILEEGLDYIAKQEAFGKFEWGLMSLLAANDPANPKAKERMEVVRKRLPEMMLAQDEIDAIMSGVVETRSKAPWRRGHTLIALSEYYLQTRDESVLPTLEACMVSIINGQSIYGTMGHIYQRPNDDGSRSSVVGYGPVNSSAMPALLGLILARECGMNHPELDAAIDRGAVFFGYYANKGVIPYGEHTPGLKSHENNGKSGLGAVIMRRLPDRKDESIFYSKLATASFFEREGGHTGPYFNYQWAPLGALAGSKEAFITHFKHISWHLDLCRRWDGGFTFSAILGNKDKDNYSGLDSSVPPMLVYAAPLQCLMVTGKGLDGELLSSEDVKQADFSAKYDAAKRSPNELVQDLSFWAPKVKREAAFEITERGIAVVDLLSQLVPIAKDAKHPGRVGALWALGRIEDSRSADALVGGLTDKDPWIRFVAAESMRTLSHDLKMTKVEDILKACASTSKPEWPLDPEDPVQFAHGRLCMLLFYGGSAYGPKGVLSGKEIKNIDRSLLYPAIRAVAKTPAGQSRSTLKYAYAQFDEDDLKALADTVVTAVVDRAPADSMFSGSVRREGVYLLRKYGYMESEAAAAHYIDSIMKGRQAKAMKEMERPKGYNPTNTFKEIQSVSADPARVKLPNKTAKIKAVGFDQAHQGSIYTWSKVSGPGEVKFKINSSEEAANNEVSLSASGKYVLKVTMSDPNGLSEISESLTIELVK